MGTSLTWDTSHVASQPGEMQTDIHAVLSNTTLSDKMTQFNNYSQDMSIKVRYTDMLMDE